jgi:glutaminase
MQEFDHSTLSTVELTGTVSRETAGLEGIHSPVLDYLDDLHTKYADVRTGAVANYIPELGNADPDWFSICITTADGRTYEVGDSQQAFTIQSISKPFTYGIALQDLGRDAVIPKIGLEPTGDAFNSISLSPDTGAPLNPMINAGAIAACGLVSGASSSTKFDRILQAFSEYAGRPLTMNEAVFESECSTGHRNRAIGHMLRNFDIIENDPEPVLQTYFRQCSIEVTCHDLSIMAATLAAGGENPVTGVRVLEETYVDNVLSIMATCGMYDYSGEWFYTVGLPAKSGVCGGIIAVLPGQLGIAVFSPPLDARGNSVRGIGVCKELSLDLGLHVFSVSRPSTVPVRSTYTAADVHSKRVRAPEAQRALHDIGHRAVVFDLQGDLGFSALEMITRRVVAACKGRDVALVLLDFKRVSRVDLGVAWMLVNLLHQLASQNMRLLFSDVERHTKLSAYLQHELGGVLTWANLIHPDLDSALEWCEDRLLEETKLFGDASASVPLREHLLCARLGEDDIDQILAMVERIEFERGDIVVHAGEPADALYLLLNGKLSVTIGLADGGRRRLATLLPGMMFGELSITQRHNRSANVTADTAGECFALPLDALDRLGDENPSLKAALLENILESVSQTVYRLSAEVRALAE